MTGSPQEAGRLEKRVAWRPSLISDGDQDGAKEVATVGQQNFDTFDTKTQKEENRWTLYTNQGIGSYDSGTHTARLTGQL